MRGAAFSGLKRSGRLCIYLNQTPIAVSSHFSVDLEYLIIECRLFYLIKLSMTSWDGLMPLSISHIQTRVNLLLRHQHHHQPPHQHLYQLPTLFWNTLTCVWVQNRSPTASLRMIWEGKSANTNTNSWLNSDTLLTPDAYRKEFRISLTSNHPVGHPNQLFHPGMVVDVKLAVN